MRRRIVTLGQGVTVSPFGSGATLGDVCNTYRSTQGSTGLCVPSRVRQPVMPQPIPPEPSVVINRRQDQLERSQPYFNPDVSRLFPPTDAHEFIVTPTIFPNYPAPGAPAVVVITFIVPPGAMAVINKLAVVHFGGNPPDGTGNVVWRVRRNFAPEKGLGNLTSQVGTYANPNDVIIVGIEGDIFDVTAEVPAAQPPMPPTASTAARFHGYTISLIRGTGKYNPKV